jgi:hypothetical protein
MVAQFQSSCFFTPKEIRTLDLMRMPPIPWSRWRRLDLWVNTVVLMVLVLEDAEVAGRRVRWGPGIAKIRSLGRFSSSLVFGWIG